MPLLLLFAFVIVPLVELAVIVQVAQLTNLPVTLVLLLAVSLIGAVLVKREGGRAWRAFREALAAGRTPAREVADGMMVLVGGALLLTPGFVTDAVGLLLVFPPTRALLRGWLTGFLARSLVVRTIGVDPGRMRAPRQRPAAPGRPPGRTAGPGRGAGRAGSGVVEGEVVSEEPPGRGAAAPPDPGAARPPDPPR